MTTSRHNLLPSANSRCPFYFRRLAAVSCCWTLALRLLWLRENVKLQAP